MEKGLLASVGSRKPPLFRFCDVHPRTLRPSPSCPRGQNGKNTTPNLFCFLLHWPPHVCCVVACPPPTATAAAAAGLAFSTQPTDGAVLFAKGSCSCSCSSGTAAERDSAEHVACGALLDGRGCCAVFWCTAARRRQAALLFRCDGAAGEAQWHLPRKSVHFQTLLVYWSLVG